MNVPVDKFGIPIPEAPTETTDEMRERDEHALADTPLHTHFTRREFPWHRNRSKYEPHRGVQQMLRSEEGMTRAQARDAVRRFHQERDAGGPRRGCRGADAGRRVDGDGARWRKSLRRGNTSGPA